MREGEGANMRRRRNNAEHATIQQLESEGWTVHSRGWPDLLCVHSDGRIKFVEVKSTTSTGIQQLSKAQELIHGILKSLGLSVETVWSEAGGIHRPDPNKRRARVNAELLEHQLQEKIAGKADNLWRVHYGSDRDSQSRGDVTVTSRGNRLFVAAPYREEWLNSMKALKGSRWNRAIRVWSIPLAEKQTVRGLIESIYGSEFVPAWMKR